MTDMQIIIAFVCLVLFADGYDDSKRGRGFRTGQCIACMIGVGLVVLDAILSHLGIMTVLA